MRTVTAVIAISIVATLTVSGCKDSKATGGEECSWGITCPGGTSCHEPTL